MVDAFFFVGLPYLAIVICVAGCIWRSRYDQFSMSARSSQFLEDGKLLFGSLPWHVGIITILLGHLVVAVVPRVWSSLMVIPAVLFGVEALGVCCSLLAIAGLSALIVRRITDARVQAVTTTMDLVVVVLLMAQIVIGLLSSITFRYGAAWSAGTVVPYFWGILTLQPEMAHVTGFPMLFKLHIIGAWVLIALVPFTRLMHVLAVPLGYIFRAPQLVLWNNPRRRREAVDATARAESRRDFIKGAVGIAGASGLLALGVSEKVVTYFKGPDPDPEAESALLQKKLERLQQTAEERQLELERQRVEMILVARYIELDAAKGKYFIDYAMAPGLAFKGKNGLPLLISAKCTHLGCTVGSQVNAEGQIMCPCHVSYFNIVTGQPNPGAPAKLPLPHLAWALVDPSGNVVASGLPGGEVEGTPSPELLAQCSLYITKPRHSA
ncbi:MAG: respiratory nitrate reductase subunit gamma [Verrucomicrobiaceae bacterium]|nr:MAG: respiratory nitrate reductase subunit gamma [Verrucomicrobiaceae bacterium]